MVAAVMLSSNSNSSIGLVGGVAAPPPSPPARGRRPWYYLRAHLAEVTPVAVGNLYQYRYA